MSQGLTTPGLAALDAMLARHVEQAEVPGLVALVARAMTCTWRRWGIRPSATATRSGVMPSSVLLRSPSRSRVRRRCRFTTFYGPSAGELQGLDRPGGWYSSPPKRPDAAGGLVSTVDDLWTFASMLASGGGRLLSAESVRQPTPDRMTARDRAAGPPCRS